MRWLLLVALCGCESGSGNPYVAAANERGGGLRCEEVARCNGIVKVDCASAVDGPLYYFDEDTVEVIATCGGACWSPDPIVREMCRTSCPPPGWTCGN